MPETLTTPPPALPPTPSPAPAPPSAPAAPPAPSAPPSPEPDEFAELTKKFADADAPRPQTKGVEEPKKPETPATPAQAIKPPQEKVVAGPKQLRDAYEKATGELKAKETALTELQKKIADYESRGKDTDQLLGRLQTLEKQIAEKDAQLRRARKEVSVDFKQKWDEPFSEMAEDAAAVFNQLQVAPVKKTDEMGNEIVITPARQAVWEKDFAAIFAMDRGNAYRTTKAMFGDEAQLVMSYYDRLHENRRGRDRALRREQEQAAQLEKQEQEQETQRKSTYFNLLQKVNQELSEAIEDYHDAPDDKTLVEARNEGYRLFDERPATFEQSLKKAAHIRQRFAAYTPMKLTILRLQRELAAAKEKLDGYANKTPNPKSPGGEPTGEPEEDWEAAARKAVTG